MQTPQDEIQEVEERGIQSQKTTIPPMLETVVSTIGLPGVNHLVPTERSSTCPMDGWLDTVRLDGKEDLVRVVLEEREGSNVLLRQVDPGEPEPPRIEIFKGDEIKVMQAVSHLGIHRAGDSVGKSGFLFPYRVVPVKREPGIVYARTLRHGEVDTGARIHIRSGEKIKFEAKDVVVELAHIDAMEPASPSGYVPLTPVLWTWITLGDTNEIQSRTRYLLAASRRLDTANLLMIIVENNRAVLKRQELGPPKLRRAMFELIGAVELAIVALSRALDMVKATAEKVGTSATVPQAIIDSMPAITAIRNAYEHIEDRALGKVREKDDETALTIFRHESLIDRDRIEYGDYHLDLASEVPNLLHQARKFLIETAGDESQGALIAQMP